MNLLTDKWIPVIRKNGAVDEISPLSLLEDSRTNPVISVHTVRPDFDGAVLQFLIGVYQILLSPEDEDEWRDLLDFPPEKSGLAEKIDLISPAFNFDEGEFRFMQDRSVIDTDVWNLPDLLIEINNTHFLKEGTVQHFCPKCAARALLTLELNSPSGGRGHLTSLRGGGPLTTLLALPSAQETLWRSVVLNILPEDAFGDADMQITMKNLDKVFPWLGKMPNLEEHGVVVPKDMHPYHVFWNVSRRIYIDTAQKESGVCDVCGSKSDSLLSKYWSRPNGIKYESWSHPLTPYYLKKSSDGDLYLPVRGREGGVTYANWIGFVLGSNDNSHVPALTVRSNSSALYGDGEFTELKIHAFGYALENAKARVWQEGTLPTVLVRPEENERFSADAGCLISAASEILYILVQKVKEGFTRDKQGLSGDFSDIKAEFWNVSESAFYTCLNKLPDAISADLASSSEDCACVNALKRSWLVEVRGICIELFKERVSMPVCGEADPKQAALAELGLRSLISDKNPKLCKVLGLPVPEKKAKAKVKK